MVKKTTLEQRRELGSFLSSRRARLEPKEFGLPEGPRRTPGLRREEVAVLSGVSVSWYTWLEQGRDLSPPPKPCDVLRKYSSSTGLNPPTCLRSRRVRNPRKSSPAAV